LPFHVKIKL